MQHPLKSQLISKNNNSYYGLYQISYPCTKCRACNSPIHGNNENIIKQHIIAPTLMDKTIPNPGFPAVTIRLWKSTCIILAGVNSSNTKRYCLQYGNSNSLAPNPHMSLSMDRRPAIATIVPRIAPAKTISVKSCDARFVFQSPIFLATIALPPVANIAPRPTMTLITGVTIFKADNASVLTKRDMMMVSPMVYNPIKIIIKMVGNANCKSDFIVKSLQANFGDFLKGFHSLSLASKSYFCRVSFCVG